MKLRSVLLSFVLIAAAAIAGGAQTSSQPSLGGSMWVGYDLDGVMTFHFENDGILSYRYGGNSFRNGRWTLSGNVVKFQMNDGYRVFTGTIDDQTITGKSSNETGKNWDLTIYRVDPPNCDPSFFILAERCKPLKNAKPAGKVITKKKPAARN